ncbi:hypothetical protein Cni_G19827 [Canna indica]|uniref:non-specific serine/threonine protein kinase n=1 Tax=Canna indica TaxID=4628 RepID=A0AAQ3KS37_9LILI|nr:hypothetical protein Cni_G19827 [Canna indica]
MTYGQSRQFTPANSLVQKILRISEATSTSSSTMTKPSHMRSREPKFNGSNTCNNQGRCSSTVVYCFDSYSTTSIRRHKGDDFRWKAIPLVNSKGLPISLSHFKFVRRIGYGDIGYVYLAELKETNTIFAITIMDKASLVSRNKLFQAQIEREILSLLDHPFLLSLVMEYCNGGNLHSLRQKQPNKHFIEKNARFYASEVLLAIEYLHMLGIVYRDLKPENVLVRDDDHIMLSDFDLSL